MSGVAPKITGACHRAVGLCQRQRANVAEERVCGGTRTVRFPTSVLHPAQIGQRMGHGIRHLQLRLVGGDLVDDIAIRCSERAEGSVPALITVGRITFIDEAPPGYIRGYHEILLSSPNLRAQRCDQTIAQVGALQQQRELLVDRAVQRVNRIHAQQGDPEDERQEQGHAPDDPAPETSQYLHWRLASRTSPSRTMPICTVWLGTSPRMSNATEPVTPLNAGVPVPTWASARRTSSRSGPTLAITSRSRYTASYVAAAGWLGSPEPGNFLRYACRKLLLAGLARIGR